jgi:hypothetical protein
VIICIPQAHCWRTAGTQRIHGGAVHWIHNIARRWRPFNKNPSGVAPIRTRTTFSQTRVRTVASIYTRPSQRARARQGLLASAAHSRLTYTPLPHACARPRPYTTACQGAPSPSRRYARGQDACLTSLVSEHRLSSRGCIDIDPAAHRPCSCPRPHPGASAADPAHGTPDSVQRPRHTHDLHGRTALDHTNPPPLHLNLRERKGHAARHAGTAPRWSKNIPRSDCTHPARRESPRSARVDATVRRVMAGEDECR